MVAVAEPHWNNASGASSTTGLALVDSTGAATSATVTWTANNTWQLPITDQPGNVRMMKGYLDDGNGSTTTVSVTGLPSTRPGTKSTCTRTGSNSSTSTSIYTISGDGDYGTTAISLTDAANANFSGTFTQANGSAGNYVVFAIPNVTGFTISATPNYAAGSYRAPVNGIQIVPQ